MYFFHTILPFRILVFFYGKWIIFITQYMLIMVPHLSTPPSSDLPHFPAHLDQPLSVSLRKQASKC